MEKEAALELIKSGAVAAVGIKLITEFSSVFGSDVTLSTIQFVVPMAIGLCGLTVLLYFAWE